MPANALASARIARQARAAACAAATQGDGIGRSPDPPIHHRPISRSGAPSARPRARAARLPGRCAAASAARGLPIALAARRPQTPTLAQCAYTFSLSADLVGRRIRGERTRRTPRTAREDDARRRPPSGLSESRPLAGCLDILLLRTQIP
ncbi:acetyltransferase, GNAT family domain protein [Burkholderia thailandensis]|uniref:Acetyltransferase, GNAT family domain protein n=1 Tax=Burkholderia thailandensis TaxID=57975 RepID=A0AAW9D391_BURTH|nr:hypothetical protein AQ475_15160 [Burkholderia thailandensis]AVR24375.1 hypothetical protein A8H32_03880 [Burkholderia thailandensis]MDW9240675.1 acetyltransferase, GNAT family domain protein [Burkholderia thailandensis]MDW9256024.1 acetyltransferase, GNAT family domain protein [Burkholderia thailandensis]PJO72259.1 hypothetical protein CWD92_10235 [Burkholderia thailandensis]